MLFRNIKKTLPISLLVFTLGACGGGSSDNSDTSTPSSNPSNSSGTLSERFISKFQKGTSYFYLNSPMLNGDNVYIGTSRKHHANPAEDNFIFKLTTSLAEVWSYPLKTSEILGSVSMDSSGNLYAMLLKERKEIFLISLNEEGNFRWEKPIFSPSNSDTAFHMTSPAITSNDMIIVNALNSIISFDSNGNQLWSFPSTGLFGGSPIIDELDNIYISGVDGGTGFATQYAIDSTGVELWSYQSNKNNMMITASSSAFSYDYSKIYSIFNDTVYVMDLLTGSLNWKYTFSNTQETLINASPAVDDEGNLYVGSKGNDQSTFYALKADGSGLLWSKKIGADLYSSPALGNNRVLYVGSEITKSGDNKSSRIHAINMDTGEFVWQSITPVSGDITWSSPLISPSGVLFIANMIDHNDGEEDSIALGGSIMSFQTDSSGLLSTAGTARYRQSNKATGRR